MMLARVARRCLRYFEAACRAFIYATPLLHTALDALRFTLAADAAAAPALFFALLRHADAAAP